MKHVPTQIIATISPQSGTPEMLEKMIGAGMDVIRLNMSHGTHEEHAGFITTVRGLGKKLGKRIPVIMDLSGPRETTDEGHGFDTTQDMLTDKDRNDIKLGVEYSVDYFAQSYVGSAQDVALLKEIIASEGASIPVIAKIERQIAIDNFPEILKASNAIMVARGDLGDAIPFEKVPFVQDELIHQSNSSKKPIIVATEMMTSMIDSTKPTRAEVTDIAHAVVSGANAVMLSNETAIGKFPVETIAAMHRVVAEAEKYRKHTTSLPL